MISFNGGSSNISDGPEFIILSVGVIIGILIILLFNCTLDSKIIKGNFIAIHGNVYSCKILKD